MARLNWLSILFCILSTSYLSTAEDGKTLKMAHVLYRHGARSPVLFYPNARHTEKDWPDGRGWLTTNGIQMEYRLGQFLRSRYIYQKKLTTTRYNHDEIYVQSSAKDRCIQSAQSQLAGLYPPEKDQIWNPKINWQPIPVHLPNPVDNDPILRAHRSFCPKRDAIIAKRKQHTVYKKKVADSANLFKRMTNYSGMEINEDTIWVLLDVTESERAQGFPVPKWIVENYKEMKDYQRWTHSYEHQGGDELALLLGGPLLSKMISNMESADAQIIHSADELNTHHEKRINMYSAEDSKMDAADESNKHSADNKNKPPPKLSIYSGHDHTVEGLAAALGVKITPPDFSACLMVELYYQPTIGYTVELYYRNGGHTVELRVTGCEQSCPLKTFIELTSKRVSKNRNKECSA